VYLDKDIAEQCSLFECVVKRHVVVWQAVELAPGHGVLGASPVVLAQQQHGHGLDVECGKSERAASGKADQVLVHEHEIERRRVADEYRWSWQRH
jgi:hypothetical protein